MEIIFFHTLKMPVEISLAADSDTSLLEMPHAATSIYDDTPATVPATSCLKISCPKSWTKGDVTTSSGAVYSDEGDVSTKGAIGSAAVISLEGECSGTANEGKTAACVSSNTSFDM
jgi:hypothetical protein